MLTYYNWHYSKYMWFSTPGKCYFLLFSSIANSIWPKTYNLTMKNYLIQSIYEVPYTCIKSPWHMYIHLFCDRIILKSARYIYFNYNRVILVTNERNQIHFSVSLVIDIIQAKFWLSSTCFTWWNLVIKT